MGFPIPQLTFRLQRLPPSLTYTLWLPSLETLILRAAEAWSICERLVPGTGPLIRIQRESDLAFLDVGSESNGLLDVSAVVSFCTPGGIPTNGWCRRLYGQVHGGLLLSNPLVPTSLPLIYSEITGLQLLGGQPCVTLDGVNDAFSRDPDSASGMAGVTDATVAAVVSRTAGTGIPIGFGTNAPGEAFQLQAEAATTLRLGFGGSFRDFAAPDLADGLPHQLVGMLAAGAQIGTAEARQDGVALSQSGVLNPTSTTNYGNTATRVGSSLGGASFWNGRISEIVLWPEILDSEDLAVWDAHCANRFGI